MDDTKKILRTIINGQRVMKSELLTKIDKLDKNLTTIIGKLENKMDDGFKKVNQRIDKIGLQVANLEDDAPTIEEFDKLKNRVNKYLPL